MKSMKTIYAAAVILTLTNCISMKIVDPSKKMSSGFPEESYTGTLFGIQFGGAQLNCESGLQEVRFERPFWAGLLFEIYGILPLYINFRKSTSMCADSDGVQSSLDGSGNFNDIISLKNGEILTGVKAAVTGDSVVVTTKKGKVSVYKKKDVLGIKKQ